MSEYTYELHEHGETYVIIQDDKFIDPQELCKRLNEFEDMGKKVWAGELIECEQKVKELESEIVGDPWRYNE